MEAPYKVINFSKITRQMESPTFLLMTRSLQIINIIHDHVNWSISLVGNGLDEISFETHKYYNGNISPVWDDITDLKLVYVRDFGVYEISVNYTDNTETVKMVHGKSLEVELAQIPLYEFHVNDDEAIKYMTEKDTDKNGNFIPTVLYDPEDTKHSLLHRVLADKAPHWSIDYVSPLFQINGKVYEPNMIQRVFTIDGKTPYDFFKSELSEEINCVFTYNTYARKVNCWNIEECVYNILTREVVEGAYAVTSYDADGNKSYKYYDSNNVLLANQEEYGYCEGIGEDTLVFISKNKLANEINISSNKDNVKNCFRIEGGDDVITNMVGAVNMNGSNYIYQFADFQYEDMPETLVDKIKTYNEEIAKQTDTYYGENGIYTRLCKAYDDLAYYESSMMPDVSIKETTAKEQYDIMKDALTGMTVGVSSFNHYNNNLFVGVSNNIEAMANVLIDARYKAEVIKNTTSYYSDEENNIHEWTGNIRITRAADETDYYPKTEEQINTCFKVNIDDDELTFTRQKIEKALHKGSMLDIDFEVAEMNDDEMKEYFSLYSLNSLKSFYDGYNSCLSILMSLNSTSSIRKEMYDRYYNRLSIVSGVLDERQKQIDMINADIENITKEQQEFQDKWNFQKYLGEDLYKIYCSYRREDVYKNDNYVSDGLSTGESLLKAKELVEAAVKEAKKACMLQRTISISLNNLFALPEFEPLYEKFALYNYIRVRTEDEILKLRLIGVEFNSEYVTEINVTFSDKIESVDGTKSYLQNIIKQAGSMATSFPSTALQARKGADAQNAVTNIYSKGLDAAKAMISSSDEQDVTITKSGIICKRMEDEDCYSNNQLRITNNIIGFTRDGWKTVSEAIGEILYTDPDTGEESLKYGVIAEAVIGKMIAGENLYIGNENGSVKITGNGIDITNGKIQLSNETNCINLDPDSDMLFQLKNVADDSLIMGVDNEGKGYFKGAICAASWESENFEVDENGKVIAKNISIIGGSVNIEFSDSVQWGDSTRTIDYKLVLDHGGLSFEQLDDMTSYSVDLKADGLMFNGAKIIDNPGQTLPSIGNINDVTTYDGISLRSLDSNKLTINNSSDGNISNISWRVFDGVSYLVLEVDGKIARFKPDAYYLPGVELYK